ncbi:FAD-binding oxidoreductase [Streptomyces sp. S.PB5]|uniref:FAD-binding oxidoreductase n=1 Tax=Streptomyces sp. S.PB5 TaxID=3020844 RepID=UPI0025B1D4A9|nr:FAD-binding oxidoreductase [Streptomyces sp. S.PB5]MDN3028535.1 FAD-binding oxidoreductase [Streptomyces sp. S.PB5]
MDIGLDALPEALAGLAVRPGDPDYQWVRSSRMRGGRPALVLRVRNAHEVAEAVVFAGARPVPLSVRSGGHGFSGRSTNHGGIVIDLSAMNRIEVLDEGSRLVRIEPGARWGEVAAALHPHGWALTSGDHSAVGVGGLATAGGIGLLGREQGLTIDRMRAAEIVLADGRQLRVSAHENADLFWAVRGAGFAFGVVTAFEFAAEPVGLLGHAHLIQDAIDTAAFLRAWAEAARSAPRDTTAFLTVGRPHDGRVIAQSTILVDCEDTDLIRARIRPFLAAGPPLVQHVGLADYSDVVPEPEGLCTAEGEPVSRSGLLDRLGPAAARAAADLITGGESHFFQLRAMGGAIADVDSAATAFAHRSAAFQVVAMGIDPARLDRSWEPLRAHLSGLYVSFETDIRPERLTEAFPPDTLARLVELKKTYDPHNVFHDNLDLTRAPAGRRSEPRPRPELR